MNLNNLIELKTFNIFPEYFLVISALYMLIVVVLISYNVLGLILQRSIGDCIGLIMLLACYLIINDDLLFCNTDDFGFYISLSFYKAVVMDYFGAFTKFIICFFSAVYFFIIADFLKEYKLTSFEYLLILLFAVLGLVLLCTSNDLLSAYLAIELVSLSSYLLASFKKNSSYSMEAGIKYLITGSISSAFFLLGSSFVYASIGTIYISDIWSLFVDVTWLHEQTRRTLWKDLWFLSDLEPTIWYLEDFYLSQIGWPAVVFMDYWIKKLYFRTLYTNLIISSECSELLEPFIEIGLTFILFSLFIKLALAPFHLWSLDVYEGSPIISTFFFAVITKLSIFVFLTRICYSTIHFKESWQFYAIIVSLLSIFVGSFGGLRQKKLKTLLAYSSVSHMGYVLLSLSTGTQFGIEMLIFYLVIYMLSGIAVWFTVLAVRENKTNYSNKFNKELGDLVLLRKSNPALAVSLSVAMFSIAGIPPLIGFFAKLGVFLSILYVEYYIVALSAILCSVVSTFYYIRIIKILYFENILVGKLYYPIKTDKIFFFTASVFALFLLFLNPTLMYIIIHNVVWKSFYGF
jgi:NADH:ubiquinone oxidoreductase subunit 2 (subunit N)